jgi:hypothetical protein
MKLFLAVITLVASATAQAFPWYASGKGIRGSQLMTQEERMAHIAKLQSMKTLPECETYWAAHNNDIDSRARKQNMQLPPVQGDPCQVMVQMGRISR